MWFQRLRTSVYSGEERIEFYEPPTEEELGATRYDDELIAMHPPSRFIGSIPGERADVWVNGHSVADRRRTGVVRVEIEDGDVRARRYLTAIGFEHLEDLPR